MAFNFCKAKEIVTTTTKGRQLGKWLPAGNECSGDYFPPWGYHLRKNEQPFVPDKEARAAKRP